MGKNRIFGKLSVVVFLTVLIWVWADLAQDERLRLSNVVSLSVTRSSDPTLWVSFAGQGDGPPLRPLVMIDRIDLEGPASRVNDVDRMRNTGEFDGALFLDPARENLVEEGTHALDVLSFLRRNDTIRKLGLTVEECDPTTVVVHVTRLVSKTLPVECINENGAPLRAEIEPATVDVLVPPQGVSVARVRLGPSEQNLAKGTAIEKSPYVEFTEDERRPVPTPVKVTLPAGNDLREYQVSAAWGFCFSPNTQGKFRVELGSDRAKLTNVPIKATPLAYQAYDDATYEILIYIYDSDRDASGWITRRVVYNFPEAYVRSNEIEAAQDPPEVRFQLVPIPAPAPAQATPP
jgi:hypothetical protein